MGKIGLSADCPCKKDELFTILPYDFIETDTSRHRYVQARNRTLHRYFYKFITSFHSEPSQPKTFGSHHNTDSPRQIYFVDLLCGLVGSTHKKKSGLLHLLHGLGEVRDLYDGHRFSASCRHPAHGLSHRGRSILGGYHRNGSYRICGSQAGAQIVWVLDTIKNQDQWILGLHYLLVELSFIHMGQRGIEVRVLEFPDPGFSLIVFVFSGHE